MSVEHDELTADQREARKLNIGRLLTAWQTLLHSMITSDEAAVADATSTMLAVAAYWRGEAVGHHRASIELGFYAEEQADEEMRVVAALRAEAERASKH